MSSPNTDDELIIIGCPSCNERFKVEEEFIGSMVECGACDHQFEITHDVVIKGKKFYPGENKDRLLNQFHRTKSSEFDGGMPMPMATHMDMGPSNYVEPISPVRVLLGLLGGAAIALMAAVLMLGASHGGMLDGVTTDKRLVMAGFVAFIGFILILSANPKARIRAALIGLLAAAGLISIPFFFTEGSMQLGDVEPITDNGDNGKEIKPPVTQPEKKLSTAELRELIGTGPLENEIQRLAIAGSRSKVIGIWFKNLKSNNRYLIRDYIIRVTGANMESHFYPRDNDSFLMVVTGIDISMDEMRQILAPIGDVLNIYDEIQVIEAMVDNDSFQSGSIEKLTNQEDPMFYHLNYEEMKSIDLTRIEAAVNRLADAKPKLLRADITNGLVYLMEQDWVDFKDDVAAALSVWAKDPNPASDVALRAAKKMRLDGDDVPLEIIELIVKKQNTDVIPLLNLLWLGDPSRWELIYGQVGPAAEDLMIQNFKDSKGIQRNSAIKILGQIGEVRSLDLLLSIDESTLDGETRILVRNAISSIKKRRE